jgi:GT2 family glycosyltransferase
MRISIIIPLYKRTEWIGRCIEHLSIQEYSGDYEILLVDDGSPNRTAIEEACRPDRSSSRMRINFLHREHSGPAATRNFGVKHASGDILCFLDDDSLVDKEWLREIVRPFAESSSVSLVNGRTLSLERDGLPFLLEQWVYPGKSWATCNIAYRRNVFEALGGFDESFPEPSWEDNDLGLRARWSGYHHVYNNHAIVYHPHEKSIPEFKKKCLLNGRGAAVMARKCLSRNPLWAIAIPLLMSRRLVYGLFPTAWLQGEKSPSYLNFLWSWYSLQGFIKAISDTYAKN